MQHGVLRALIERSERLRDTIGREWCAGHDAQLDHNWPWRLVILLFRSRSGRVDCHAGFSYSRKTSIRSAIQSDEGSSILAMPTERMPAHLGAPLIERIVLSRTMKARRLLPVGTDFHETAQEHMTTGIVASCCENLLTLQFGTRHFASRLYTLCNMSHC